MEDNSLLQEALSGGLGLSSLENDLQNTLEISVFLVGSKRKDRAEECQEMAQLCRECNEFFQAFMEGYHWNAGGDGPVFGVDATEGLMQLRASCRYGMSVNDEWAVVAAVLSMSKRKPGLAFRCWDTDDGHILLIESAHALPAWIDDFDPRTDSQNRCWIHKGLVKIIREKGNLPSSTISVRDALHTLQINSDHSMSTEVYSLVQASIQERVQPFLEASHNDVHRWQNFSQRAALVLPRNVAVVLGCNPQLIGCAANQFERDIATARKVPPQTTVLFEDLVWATVTMSRTSYAMLRSLVSSEWKTEDHIPKAFKSPETNRMKRACLSESTPHVHHALQVGVRLTAGLDSILRQPTTNHHQTTDTSERHILEHWTALDTACGGDGNWLRDAWVAGPQGALHDLADILKCYIFKVDLKDCFPCPKSHPGKVLQKLVKEQLRKSGTGDDASFLFPLPQDVDGEEWMTLNEEKLIEVTGTKEGTPQGAAKALDEMLDKFESFVVSESDAVAGVVSSDDKNYCDQQQPLQIDPRVFMNILHQAVTGSTEELSKMLQADHNTDPYFTQEDYDLLDPDDTTASLMDAMDSELESKSASRRKDSSAQDERIAEGEHVLKNLMESLAASGGGPGPVRNMLTEMDPKGRRS